MATVSAVSSPAALRLPGLGYRGLREEPVGRISVAPSGTKAGMAPEVPSRRRCACRVGSGIPRSVSRKNTRRPQTGRPVSIANRPSLSASAPRVSRGADTPAC
ncbi:hypothetical protein EX352_00320 [Klebsiella pneumoniae]|nr:hypothetical protein EX352_00320 [Klebsiella pneumoniae]QBH08985.1 hypothetical protein EYB55_17175 [Klebsiella pneumoniae]